MSNFSHFAAIKEQPGTNMVMNAVNVTPIGNPIPVFFGIIYKVTNKLNGKIYIGQSRKTLAKRKSEHMRESNGRGKTYFNKAIRKYGIDGFTWQVICICPNIDSLNEQEEYYIAFYDSMNTGYNLTSGGKNCIMSDESKEKIRQAKLGHPVSKETRQKIRIAASNISEDTRNKMRIAKQGKNHPNYGNHLSKETKKKIGDAHRGEKNHNYGKTATEETKEKMREAALKKPPMSDETKEKISQAQLGEKNHNYGKKASDETKEKISKNNAKYWLGKKMSLEAKEKMRHARLGRKLTEATKEKLSKLNSGQNNAMYGKKHTKESNEKNRQAHLKRWAKKRAIV